MTPVMELELEARNIGKQAIAILDKAQGFLVRDNASRTTAADLGRAIAGLDKQAKEKFDAIKKPLNEAKDRVMQWEHEVRGPLDEAKRYLSAEIGSFDDRMERERLAEEARQQAERQREADAESRRLSEEQALEDCYALEAEGDQVGADAVLANPAPVAVYVPPVVLPSSVVKAKGVSSQQVWKFKITNPELIPREYLVPDEQTIGQVVRALKDKTVIPGIQVYPENSARFRA